MQGVMNNGRRETKLGVWSKSAVCKYSKRASAGKLALDWNLRLSAVHVSTPGLGVVEGCRFVWELGSMQHDQHQHQSASSSVLQSPASALPSASAQSPWVVLKAEAK